MDTIPHRETLSIKNLTKRVSRRFSEPEKEALNMLESLSSKEALGFEEDENEPKSPSLERSLSQSSTHSSTSPKEDSLDRSDTLILPRLEDAEEALTLSDQEDPASQVHVELREEREEGEEEAGEDERGLEEGGSRPQQKALDKGKARERHASSSSTLTTSSSASETSVTPPAATTAIIPSGRASVEVEVMSPSGHEEEKEGEREGKGEGEMVVCEPLTSSAPSPLSLLLTPAPSPTPPPFPSFELRLSSASSSSSSSRPPVEAPSSSSPSSPSFPSSPSATQVAGARCPICLDDISPDDHFKLACGHELCQGCLEAYYSLEVTEGRTLLTCPIPDCSKEVAALQVQQLLPAPLFEKFTTFSLKRALKLNPDCHFCPSPDCDYAVIVQRKKRLFGLLETPCKQQAKEIKCQRPECQTSFCMDCGEVWHPQLTCEENKTILQNIGTQLTSSELVKPCPKCSVPILKVQDGTCNHMKCAVCQTEFCWLCMKEVNDLHFFSPSGCTFYATEPWGWKKKLFWRATVAVAAPPVIGLIAAASVPAIMIYVPVKTAKSISRNYKYDRLKYWLGMTLGVPLAAVSAPVLAAAAVGLGVPILLIATYGVMPIYLIREDAKNRKLSHEKKKRLKATQSEIASAEMIPS